MVQIPDICVYIQGHQLLNIIFNVKTEIIIANIYITFTMCQALF